MPWVRWTTDSHSLELPAMLPRPKRTATTAAAISVRGKWRKRRRPAGRDTAAWAAGSSGGVDLRWLLVLPLGVAAAGLFFGGKLLLKKRKSKKEWEDYTK